MLSFNIYEESESSLYPNQIDKIRSKGQPLEKSVIYKTILDEWNRASKQRQKRWMFTNGAFESDMFEFIKSKFSFSVEKVHKYKNIFDSVRYLDPEIKDCHPDVITRTILRFLDLVRCSKLREIEKQIDKERFKSLIEHNPYSGINWTYNGRYGFASVHKTGYRDCCTEKYDCRGTSGDFDWIRVYKQNSDKTLDEYTQDAKYLKLQF